LSAQKISDRLYLSQVDVKTPTPGVYKRGTSYRVLTRPDGKRKVMHRFSTYEEAVAFKATTPSYQRRGVGSVKSADVAHLRRDPCSYCGGESEAIDHIEPRAGGGTNHWSNLTAACDSCNGSKSDKPLLIFLAHRNGCWEWRKAA